MRLLLIANPVAGRQALQTIEQARAALTRHGAEVELYLTRAAGDAEERARAARSEPWQRIVAAGGDGTLNEVVNGLAGSPYPLAFIPLGTTNVFALETGIPFDVEKAAAIAIHAAPRPVTLGRAGKRYFLLMAGAGFDGEVVGGVSSRLKRAVGKGAYLAAALRQLLLRPPQLFEVRCDDRELRASGVLLANTRCYGGPFTLTPRADLERPDLEVCLLRQAGRIALLRQALALLRGRELVAPLGEVVRGTRLEIVTPGIAVQLDGDFFARTPMTFDCVPGDLQLVYPPPHREDIHAGI